MHAIIQVDHSLPDAMSYAIEAKKRKFDRILESLTDRSTPPRTSLNTRNNGSTISLVGSDESDSAKKRRLNSMPGAGVPPSQSTISLIHSYLPSDREAFLERLETFRQVTKWRIPSTERINAAQWAKRGWVCVDTNLVSCSACHERLLVDIDDGDRSQGDFEMEQQEDDAEDQLDLYMEVVKKYEELIVDAHKTSCPWRTRGCDKSIQRINGLLNVSTVITKLKERYDGILQNPEKLPCVQIISEDVPDVSQKARAFLFEGTDETIEDALNLAICGWQRKDGDVVECRQCFRSLGLWLYRGHEPTMERLDPVRSHLEYCPWICPETQDTEITWSWSAGDGEESKRKASGWELVSFAVMRDNVKKGRTTSSKQTPVALEQTEGNLTPEQREKRMKELLKKIKEIKKPFNIKGLLRRKEKS